MNSRRSHLVLVVAGCAALATVTPAPGAEAGQQTTSRSSAKLVGHRYLDADRGGTVRAPGVRLFVPPGIMRRDGLATITRIRWGIYDIHIAAPWAGQVAVTFKNDRRARKRRGRAVVAHRVSGIWMVQRPGRQSRRSRTVWTSSLSAWTSIKKVIDRLNIARCFRKPSNLAKLVCLADSGIEIPLEILHELLKGNEECKREVIELARLAPSDTVILPPGVGDIDCVRNVDAPGGRPPTRPPAQPLPQLPYQPIAPLQPVPTPGPVRRALVVDNRVTNGMGMREDTTPARLTTRPWKLCTSRGCNIYGTERSSGQVYDAAVCQTFGDRITNGHDTNPSDDANPLRFESTRYYGVRLAGGTFGFVSEVWIRADFRGGLGLPPC